MPILKHPPQPNTAGRTTLSREERNRETALYHANLIQERRDAQIEILKSTETLLEFPHCSKSDPAYPIERDTIEVKQLLRIFQPSDYDSLITERNIDRKCGYVLCPRPNRLQKTNAKYRILRSDSNGSPSLKFVEREELEKWCSDECGKRALYVRVQLCQEPGWTRPEGIDGFTLLKGEGLQERLDPDTGALVGKLQKLEVSYEEERLIANLKELAIERGDGSTRFRRSNLMGLNVHEKEGLGDATPTPPVSSSHTSSGADCGGSVEGYIPKLANGKFS